MRRSLCIQIVGFLAMGLVLCAFQGASTPEQSLKEFVAAFLAGDLDKAAKYVVGGKVDPQIRPIVDQIKQQGVTLTLEDIKVKRQGDSAEVDVTSKAGGGGAPQPQTMQETVSMKLVNGGWLIVPPKGDMGSVRNKPISTIALMVTEGMSKIFGNARTSAMAASSLSNVKQLALGTIMYASDYKDVLPKTVAGWHKAIAAYLRNESLFRAPGANGSGDSYALNPKVAGKNMSKFKFPADTVLVYQGKDGKLDFAYDGRAPVAFCDGHARLIDKEAAKKLRWAP